MRCKGFGRNGSRNSDGKSALIGDADAGGSSGHHGVLATFGLACVPSKSWTHHIKVVARPTPNRINATFSLIASSTLPAVALPRAEAVRLHVEAGEAGAKVATEAAAEAAAAAVGTRLEAMHIVILSKYNFSSFP